MVGSRVQGSKIPTSGDSIVIFKLCSFQYCCFEKLVVGTEVGLCFLPSVSIGMHDYHLMYKRETTDSSLFNVALCMLFCLMYVFFP